MKILLISPERTRSSILSEFLIKKHCLSIWLNDEENSFFRERDKIFKLTKHNRIRNQLESRDWQNLPFEKTPDFFFDSHKKYFNNLINNDFSFCIKIHTSDIIAMDWSGEIIDLNDMNLDLFDFIYFSQRDDISEFVSSYFIAFVENGWQIFKDTPFKEIKKQEIPLDFIDNTITIKVWSDIIIDQIKFYLEKRNINYCSLEYHEIPNWIEKNTDDKILKFMEDPRIQPMKNISKIPSNIIYKETIKNYDVILKRYNEKKDNLINLFYTQNPKLQRIRKHSINS